MVRPEELKLLRSVREQLGAYKTVQCGMSHEKVVAVTRSEFSIRNDHPGWHIQLKGLCDVKVRRFLLGCAHTMATDSYRGLVNQLINRKIVGADTVPISEIDEVILAIYKLDHEKGRLEKLHAVLAREPGNGRQIAETENELQQAKDTHARLIGRLELLHQRVLRKLDELLEA